MAKAILVGQFNQTRLPEPTEQYQILLSKNNQNGNLVWENVNFVAAKSKPVKNFQVSRVKTLGKLSIGDKIKLGSLYGSPIVWRVIDKNHEGYPQNSVTLITDKIITMKCFDAAERGNSDGSRKSFGNNRYLYSNIRQWLNSAAGVGAWYTAQHSADAPPTNANVLGNHSGYDQAEGFLYNFSTDMQNALLSTTIMAGKANIDGGGTETCVDKVFLPSCTEMGYSSTPTCGIPFSTFHSSTTRQAYPTAECVSQSEYTHSDFNESLPMVYWSRDAYTTTSYDPYRIEYSDQPGRNAAYGNASGIRPLCNLTADFRITSTTDEDGCYLERQELDEGLQLNWNNPTDLIFAQNTIIRRSSSAYPQSLTEGEEVYKGTGETFIDTAVNLNEPRYYTAWGDNGILESEPTKASFRPYQIMGVRIDLSNSNPATCITYTDDAVGMTAGSSTWDDFFGHYPCLFQNGIEVGTLQRDDFTKFEDGTAADITSGNAGDVMIGFPRMGLRIYTVGDVLTVQMTNDPAHPEFEYLAHTRGNDWKEIFYLGAYKGNVINSKLRSLSGKMPTASQTIATSRTRAQANGAGYENSGFYQLTFRQAMYLLKYKNLNSQIVVGRGYVDSNRAPTVTESAALSTGGTETKGMDFGETTGLQHMKLFGLEDFWGNIWEWIDGVVTNNVRNILTATTGFNDSGLGYTDQGQGATSNIGNYMSKPQGTSKTGFLPKEVNGTADTYFCDYPYLHASCVAYFGGDWGRGSNGGVFLLKAYNISSYSDAHISARLMYL